MGPSLRDVLVFLKRGSHKVLDSSGYTGHRRCQSGLLHLEEQLREHAEQCYDCISTEHFSSILVLVFNQCPWTQIAPDLIFYG